QDAIGNIDLDDNATAVDLTFDITDILEINAVNTGNYTQQTLTSGTTTFSNVLTEFSGDMIATATDAGAVLNPGNSTLLDINDTTIPVVTGLTPANGETNATAIDFLEITYSENVRAVGGNLILRDGGDLSIVETISVTNISKTTVVDNVVTFQLDDILTKGTNYFITVAAGAFEDNQPEGNDFVGLLGVNSWSFTIQDAAPQIAFTDPVDTEIDVSRSTNITLTFDEPVNISTLEAGISIDIDQSSTGPGVDISIDMNTGTVNNSFFPTDASTFGDGTNIIVINPGITFVSGETITVTIPERSFTAVDNGAYMDVDNNEADNNATETLTFTAIVTTDNDPPILGLAEAFDSHTYGASDITLGSGTWTHTNAVASGTPLSRGASGDAVQLPAVSGNELTTFTVTDAVNFSFWYRAETGVGAGATADVLIDPGFITNVGPISSTITGYTQFNYNFPTPYTGEIQIRYDATTADEALIIDDLVIDNSSSPVDGATAVALNTTELKYRFNEEIKSGNGTIRLFAATNPDIQVLSFNASSGLLDYTANVLTVDISSLGDLPGNIKFYTTIDAGAIEDVSGNQFGGISVGDDRNFTTTTEAIPPTVTTLVPEDNGSNIATTTNLGMEFDEPLLATGAGNVTIYLSASGDVVEAFDLSIDLDNDAIPANGDAPNGIPDVFDYGRLVLTGNQLQIVNADDLAGLTGYNIRISADAFTDYSGNAFAGFLVPNQWNFTTATESVIVYPEIVANTFSPVDDAVAVSITPTLSFETSEPVNGVSGLNFTFTDITDGTGTYTLDAADFNIQYLGTDVQISGQLFEYNTDYEISIPTGAIADNSGNPTQGPYGGANWSFKTEEDDLQPTFIELLVDGATYYDIDNLVNDQLPNPAPPAYAVGTRTFRLVFDEAVQIGAGFVHLVFDGAVDDFLLESKDITVAGTVVTENFTNDAIEFDFDLPFGVNNYYVLVDATAITDVTTSPPDNNFVGIATDQWAFSTTADGVAPTLDLANDSDASFPANDDVAVVPANATQVQLQFDEPVSDDVANELVVKYASDGLIVARVPDLTSEDAVEFANTRFTYNLVFEDAQMSQLPGGTQYYVEFPVGTYSDNSGNMEANTTNLAITNWDFTVADDGAGPAIDFATGLSPADVTIVPVAASNTVTLQMTFNERVVKGTGLVKIVYSHAPTVEAASFDMSDITVVNDISGVVSVVTFPTVVLSGNLAYQVEVPNTAFVDPSGNAFAGYSNDDWQFITPNDAVLPVVMVNTPSDGNMSTAVSTDIVIDFDEPVSPSTGNIEIRHAGGAEVTPIVIDPSDGTPSQGFTRYTYNINDLSGLTDYYVLIRADAFEDNSNAMAATPNRNALYDGSITWNFRTVADAAKPQILALSPADDGFGITPGAGSAMSILFDERVTGNTGDIHVFTASADEEIATLDVTTDIVIDNTIETGSVINFTADLSGATDYYVQIDANAFVDQSGNTTDQINDEITWNFSTDVESGPSVELPYIVSRTPLSSGYTITYSGASGLFEVGETVTELSNGGTGVVVSDNGAGTLVVEFVSDPLNIVPTQMIQGSANSYVATVDAISLIEYGINDNLVLTFNEPVYVGLGNITIDNHASTPTRSIVIAANDGSAVTGSGTKTITIDIPEDLDANGVTHYVTIDPTAFRDASFKFFDQTLDGDGVWDFTTEAGATVTAAAGTTTACIGQDPVLLGSSIFIDEGNNDDFATGTFTYQISLTGDFFFDNTVTPTYGGSVSGDITGAITHNYLNSDQTLEITYTVSGTSNDDQIEIAGLAVGINSSNIISMDVPMYRSGGTAVMYGNETYHELVHINMQSEVVNVPGIAQNNVTVCEGDNGTGGANPLDNLESDFEVLITPLASHTVHWYANSDYTGEIFAFANINDPTFAELGFTSATAGTQTVYVSQSIDATGCQSQLTPVTVTILPAPDAQDLAGSDLDDDAMGLGNVCSFEEIDLGKPGNASFVGYTFDWAGANITTFGQDNEPNPVLDAPQNTDVVGPFDVENYAYTLDVTDNLGCQSLVTGNVNVRIDPRIDISLNASSAIFSYVESEDVTVNLTGSMFAGDAGAFSGTGLGGIDIDNIDGGDGDGLNASANFNTSVAGIGTHDITYTHTDGVTGCSDSEMLTYYVSAAFDIANGGLNEEYCQDASADAFDIDISDLGGAGKVGWTYVSYTVTGNGSAVTGGVGPTTLAFDPVAAWNDATIIPSADGSKIVNLTRIVNNGVSNIADGFNQIVIQPLPTVTINNMDLLYCIDATDVVLDVSVINNSNVENSPALGNQFFIAKET
ncbi:MAG: Ig-like domain-containing protein, partial [Reichenbachiella sp.]